MALSANREVNHYVDQELRTVALAASTRVYKGALSEGGPTGYARPVTGAGQCVGLAYEEGDNSGGDDGDVSVRVYTMGDFGLPLAGAVQGSVGAAVYASDDATLTLDSDAATFVGYVQGLESAGNIVLRLAGDGPARMSPIDHRTANFGVSGGSRGRRLPMRGRAGRSLRRFLSLRRRGRRLRLCAWPTRRCASHRERLAGFTSRARSRRTTSMCPSLTSATLFI
ncbi:MAG: hypothetical protein R3E58_14345 [Phycisphaerae bacterium]